MDICILVFIASLFTVAKKDDSNTNVHQQRNEFTKRDTYRVGQK